MNCSTNYIKLLIFVVYEVYCVVSHCVSFAVSSRGPDTLPLVSAHVNQCILQSTDLALLSSCRLYMLVQQLCIRTILLDVQTTFLCVFSSFTYACVLCISLICVIHFTFACVLCVGLIYVIHFSYAHVLYKSLFQNVGYSPCLFLTAYGIKFPQRLFHTL